MAKAWLKQERNDFIEVMGAKVYLKTLSFGESREAMKKAMNINMATGKADVDASLIGVLRALAQVKDWELTDEDGNKLPITLDTLDNVLNEEFVGELIQKISEKDTSGVTEQEKK